ncbi:MULTISPECIES: Rossmann-fold NAD(P)-binding domain-containing protein [Phenylobacterium]|uniref:Short-chain dehydrogenase n=1 Tax=Phenylobacterium koreense TaxID=266125 RepID=A0ABV2EKT4_9CAUL
MPRHVLIVGGSGMLSEVARALARDGGRLSHLSRRASAAWGEDGYDCDYHDEVRFAAALDLAIGRWGRPDLAIAWFRTLKIAAPRLLAQAVDGRMFQVLGSGVADPQQPDRLKTAAAVAEGLEGCRLRQVVLGFRVEDGGARWLRHEEIALGVLGAISADRTFSVIGEVDRWRARPRSA